MTSCKNQTIYVGGAFWKVSSESTYEEFDYELQRANLKKNPNLFYKLGNHLPHKMFSSNYHEKYLMHI